MPQVDARSAQTSGAGPGGSGFDAGAIRREFPILEREVRGGRLVYLDNAATTQKPLAVLDAVREHDAAHNANVHRGVHLLGEEATEAYERARRVVSRFMGASGPDEVVFTRGTTEAINLVANSWAGARLKPGDEVLVTHMEHHSNIVPWQLVCERTGARVVPAPVDDDGELVLAELERLITDRTRVVALTHVSNAMGTVNDVERVCRLARDAGAVSVIDGAQAVAHDRLDVSRIGCDFYAWSGHKLYGPTGIGVLWGRRELLAEMPPYQGGGEMIRSVSFDGSTFADAPARFEAGTPNVTGAVGLAAAIGFLDVQDRDAVARHEAEVTARAVEGLRGLAGVRIIGEPARRGPIVSFTVEGVHPHDLATVLDTRGVAIRAGHHCTQPLMERFGLVATARASFALYNTLDEADALVEAVRRASEIFRP